MIRTHDVRLLADAIKRDLRRKPPIREDYGWPSEALRILDAVMSLNRRYDRFVLPRLREFSEQHPEIRSLDDLNKLLRLAGPRSFLRTHMRYDDPGRARVLAGVVRRLLKERAKHGSLPRWAELASPADSAAFGVRGFGLAGFQYLRMLFGVQTVKPDTYIKKYVLDVVGRKVSDMDCVLLIELAGLVLGWPVREIDGRIWTKGARRA